MAESIKFYGWIVTTGSFTIMDYNPNSNHFSTSPVDEYTTDNADMLFAHWNENKQGTTGFKFYYGGMYWTRHNSQFPPYRDGYESSLSDSQGNPLYFENLPFYFGGTPTPVTPSGTTQTDIIIPASGGTGYNYIYRFLIPEDYVSGETRPLKIQVKQAATSNGEYASAVTEQWITVYPPRTETRIHATYPNSLRVNVDEGTICIYSIQDGEITLTIPEDNISSAGTPTVIEF